LRCHAKNDGHGECAVLWSAEVTHDALHKSLHHSRGE
jgi:hypothetical protein